MANLMYSAYRIPLTTKSLVEKARLVCDKLQDISGANVLVSTDVPANACATSPQRHGTHLYVCVYFDQDVRPSVFDVLGTFVNPVDATGIQDTNAPINYITIGNTEMN